MAFDHKHVAFGLSKETVAAIMMLYNMKVKICSPDRETEYFNIVAGVLQGDKLTPYLFIICLNYVLRLSIDLMKENGFKLAKETNTDTDYADDIAFLANSTSQAESLLHSLERSAGGINLHINTRLAKA